MFPTILLFLFPAVLFEGARSAGIADVSFQSIQQTKGFDIFKSNLRITKFNRTCAVLNGTIDYFFDMDNSYTVQVKSAYSRLGNNQFNEYPFKIAEKPFCHALNDSYRDYQELFKRTTNFPQVGPSGCCPLPAASYWFKHFTLKPETLPQMIPEGYWRVTALVAAKDGRQADLQLFIKVSKESYW